MKSRINQEFLRFKSQDGFELQGWLRPVEGETVVIHVHGMSGNGYENHFLDYLGDAYNKLGISFFTFDNRGRGVISSFRHQGNNAWGEGEVTAGSCYEIFEESSYDIEGALQLVQSFANTRIILQGHSLGASKVIQYLQNNKNKSIVGAILLAPTDMCAWAESDPSHTELITRAEYLIKNNQGSTLVSPQCWLDATPLSAKTYVSICRRQSAADIYSPRPAGALIGSVSLPMLLAYGDNDIGITRTDGSFQAWEKRVAPHLNSNTQLVKLAQANHAFSGSEFELAETCRKFCQRILT